VERILPQRAQGERPYFNFYIALERVPVGLAAPCCLEDTSLYLSE
jgi:hypothetical protein